MNKAIYKPKGKAGEYSEFAANFHVGCSGGCTYCYLKKGRGANILGGNKPTLKKAFRNEQHAIEVFEKELIGNLEDIRKTGIFFSFTTDPLLQETMKLTEEAAVLCVKYDVPVHILTKQTEWIRFWFGKRANKGLEEILRHDAEAPLISFGFSLTGHDELEPNSATNMERINAMWTLHSNGFKTFASIEPIIDFNSSFGTIVSALHYCDLFKIGLESGAKYNKTESFDFFWDVNRVIQNSNSRVYWKDSFIKLIGLSREDCLNIKNCVGSDFRLHKQQ